ncbi:MAG TPA: peptidoglycan bridge formation glycyltransferase FemA/FemB family protein [Candidatus Kapabacteria bacterium]|nr:peptidoglycan bridge formation glycyltransferase FemA/FemB family protein [Candidatus Kapabacteria bacterium]
MLVIPCERKEAWQEGETGSFLQSFAWGEFQRSVGKEPLRLQLSEGDIIYAQLQGFWHTLPGIRYVYVPRISFAHDTYRTAFLAYIQKQHATFARLEPIESLIGQKKGYATQNRQPRRTLVVDLAQPNDTLLAGMHAKTRYNIRLAEKKGVVIREEKNSDLFWQLNAKTTERDQFRSHDKMYYDHMLAMDMAHQLTAYVGKTPVASIILIAYGHTMTYLHGASGNVARNIMAPYLLQWAGMQLGKTMGCTQYDLWGIAPKGSGKPEAAFHTLRWEENHQWSGITRFKAGFGGEVIEYPSAVDISFRFFPYMAYRTIRALRTLL